MLMGRRFNIVKRSVLSNLLCGFNEIPIKIPASHIPGTDKLILKFAWKANDPDWPAPCWRRRAVEPTLPGIGVTVKLQGSSQHRTGERMDKLNFVKIKNLGSLEDNVERMRRKAQTGREIFAEDMHISRI